ncbi:MAG: TIGR04133 family radical SAM/SPASM protein [Bacteroidaceae bacterium]|nr:TIGR04133 family radical SAM/SPASM protein [Bacteroidaceae bacterium]
MSKLSIRQKMGLELERQLRQNKVKLHPLRQLFWECTLRCNLKCKHCGSDCKMEELTPDMPAEDFLRVIDEQVTPHVNPHEVLIIISGGEPLVRKDIEDVGLALYKREYPWGMVTNGMALTEERFKRLCASGLRSMAVSLDGMEDDHNWMRGHESSFKNAMRAIRLLAGQRSVVWDVVTCVNNRNVNYLPQLKEMLYEAGVRDWRLFTIFPAGRAKQHPDLQISDEQFRQVMEFIIACRQEGKVHTSFACEGFLGEYEGKVRDHLYHCAAGISVASILIDGNISACTSIRGKYYQGNIYKENFWDVWENRFESYRNRDWMKQGECADCKMFRYCEGGGMHLRDEEGNLLLCHLKRLAEK